MDAKDYILVVGLNRSGTKWLSNSLAGHEDVFAVTAKQHFGIVESNIFNDFSRVFPSLEREDDYVAFICMWAESDFVKTTGIKRECMLNWQPRPMTVYDAFARFMNDAASQQSKTVWLQKCSPLQALDARGKLPGNEKIIAIRRSIYKVLESAIALHEQSQANSNFLRNAIVVAIQNRLLDYYWQDEKCLNVRFEDLASDSESTIKNVCEFVKLPVDKIRSETEYQQNTSFKNKQRIQLSALQKMTLQLINAGLKLIPISWVAALWRRSRSRSPLSIVTGTYRTISENWPSET